MVGLDVKDITGLTQDSRKVQPGYLFAALPGAKVDGRDFISAAIEKGASYILAPNDTPEIEGATLIRDPNPRRAFAWLAADFYKKQPGLIAAITGTNGKTSIVSFLEQLWKEAGYNASSLGTLSGNMTTMETVALHETLSDLAQEGVDHLAMEASSHGLAQYRMDGAKIKVAGFSNLSRDHLDYHIDMDDYFAAKARLFSEVLEEGGAAVLNADIHEFGKLQHICEKRNVRIIDYGEKARHIRLVHRKLLPNGQILELEICGQPHTITLPLVGTFQAYNAMCALGMAMASDMDNLESYLRTLKHIKGAPGRLQSIAGHPKKSGIYIDYAHTPDALETVLEALRPHASGQLVCVFGCGGDRDKGKRPLMGEIASRLADIAIVTDDNPRSEEPTAIRAEILSAARDAYDIGDRRKAIHTAIEGLEAGDILVIAGKGHEQGQIFADRTDHFDDAEEAQKAIEQLS